MDGRSKVRGYWKMIRAAPTTLQMARRRRRRLETAGRGGTHARTRKRARYGKRGQEKTRFRGRDRVASTFTFAAADYNLLRLPKLIAEAG